MIRSRDNPASTEPGALQAAIRGVDPNAATLTLGADGEANLALALALRGLESKTLDPYISGWRKRVVPAFGHVSVRMITNGAVDRAVSGVRAGDIDVAT